RLRTLPTGRKRTRRTLQIHTQKLANLPLHGSPPRQIHKLMIKFPYNILVIIFSAATLLFSLMMIFGLATDPNAVDGNVLAILIMTPFAIAPLLAIYVALKKPTPIPFSIDEGTE